MNFQYPKFRNGGAPAARSRAALLGLGVALISVPEALPYLENNALVRLVPSWYADLGPISLYYATRTLQPAKTRVFVDFVLEAFRRDRLAERFAGSLVGAVRPGSRDGGGLRVSGHSAGRIGGTSG
jgi:hypothetical protein